MEHRNFLCQFRSHYSVVAGYSYEIIEQFHITDIIVVHICIIYSTYVEWYIV